MIISSCLAGRTSYLLTDNNLMDTCFKYNCTLILGLEPIRRIRSVGYVLSLLFELIYRSGVMASAALRGGGDRGAAAPGPAVLGRVETL